MNERNLIDWSIIERSVIRSLGASNKGWIRCVTYGLEKVKERCDEIEIDYPEIWDIKQKMGGLRIYYSEPTKDMIVSAFISDAIKTANRSCEICGNACEPQNLGGWIRCVCCWCAHEEAKKREMKPLFNQHRQPEDGHLVCSHCNYIGQIAWAASGYRCPACVSQGLG